MRDQEEELVVAESHRSHGPFWQQYYVFWVGDGWQKMCPVEPNDGETAWSSWLPDGQELQ